MAFSVSLKMSADVIVTRFPVGRPNAVLIVASAADMDSILDLVDKLKAQMVMKSYDEFAKSGSGPGWAGSQKEAS